MSDFQPQYDDEKNLPSELIVFIRVIGLRKVSKHQQFQRPKQRVERGAPKQSQGWKPSYQGEEPPF